MTYTIPVVGQNTIIIPTGSTDTSTCLTLVGKNVPGYGQAINRNLMNMMQNFAGSALPQAAVEGQLWFDTTNRQLKVYNGTTLKTLPMLSFASSTPSYPYTGELWWDSSVNLFKIYNGTGWVTIGPYSISTSSGAVPDSIADSNRILRDILTFNIDGNVIGILAKEKFIPLTAYNGLVSIDKGFNLTPTAGITSNFANITTLRGITVTATNISATAIGNTNTTLTANTITTTSAINAGGNIFVSGNIIPTSNVAYDLGNATANWRSLYLSGNTIYFGNIILKDTGGSLGVFDTTGSTPAPVVMPSLNNTPIGNATPSTGAFTTLTATSGYQGAVSGTFNGTIGVTTPNSGAFTTLTATSGYQGAVSGPVTGTIGATTPNSGAFTTLTATSGYQGAVSGTFNGTIGATTPNSGAFTTLTATSGYQGAVSGTFNGTLGATNPNSVVATSIATTSGGQVTGYLTGAIGANTANSGAFTTITASNTMSISGTANFAGTLNAATMQAATIGNSGALIVGSMTTNSQPNITSLGALTGLTVNGIVNATTVNGSLNGPFNGTIGATTANAGTFSNVTVNSKLTGPGGQFNLWGNSTVSGIILGGDLNGAGYNLNNIVIGYNNPAAAYFTTANVSGNLNASNIYAGNIAFSNGFTLLNYINANPTYSNTNVSAYLTAYPAGSYTYANSNVASYLAAGSLNLGTISNLGNIIGNVNIVNTPIDGNPLGEIQSGRMMARYNATKGVFFDVNNNGTVNVNDALIIARLEASLNASSGGFEYLQPALGSNFGSKKVGVGFHVGTTSEIIANGVNVPTSTISGNVNAVVLGYMNNGPRILLMDYALSDNQANVTTYNSTLHRFYGNIGVGVSNASVALDVAGSISATGNLTVGNIAATGNLTVGNITATGTVVMASSFKRNHVINGNMKVAQRGTSFTNVGSGSPLQYTLDRWFGYRTSYAGGLSISQQAGFAGAQYCLRHQRAASDTNIGGMLIGQIIESSNLIDLQGQNVTVSFWARTGANYSGGSLTVGLATGTTADEGSTAFVSGWTGGSYPINTTQAITSTATRYTFTGTVPSNALEMIFHIVWTPSGTAGAADYIEITNVQIEPGIVATPYEYQKINEQLAECQRYCFTIPAAGGAYAVYPGTAINTTTTFVFVTYPVTPRKAFTSITVKGLNSYYNLINWTNSGTGSATGITLLDSSINVGTISITTTAGSPTISAGNSIGLRLQNTGATLVFEGAEL